MISIKHVLNADHFPTISIGTAGCYHLPRQRHHVRPWPTATRAGMRLVGCHKVAVPRLNEYKVPILPQVQVSLAQPIYLRTYSCSPLKNTAQCGVPVPPAFFCRFLCASLFYNQSGKPFFLAPGIQSVSCVFCLKLSSRALNTVRIVLYVFFSPRILI